MTQGSVPLQRRSPAASATTDIVVAAPPELPAPASQGPLQRALPVVLSAGTAALMVVVFFSRSATPQNPTFLAFPVMMLISVVITAAARRGPQRGRAIEANRFDYFEYLDDLRARVSETAAAQRLAMVWDHPDPETLWTLIGGPRMWERRPGDPDFCCARVGVGTLALATRLVAPETPPAERSDPVTAEGLRGFIDTHCAITDAPITVPNSWDGRSDSRWGIRASCVDGSARSSASWRCCMNPTSC